jgi:signal transduction histidine kinase
MESAFNINRVYGVYVYNEHGTPIYASGTRGAEMSRDRAAELAVQREQRGEFGTAGTEEVFSYFVPLVDGGERVIGLLQVTRRGSEFDSYLATVRRSSTQVILISGIILAGAVLLAHGLGVGRQLWNYERSIKRIRAGALDHRLTPFGPRELQVLGNGINDMLDAIVESNALLESQKEREADLQRKLHESEKLAALGQLAAGVAHELGSPLSTLDGKAQQALRKQETSPDMGNTLNSIREQAARMAIIIRQLLDFGRTNPVNRRRVSVAFPLHAVLKMIDPKEPVSITTDIPPQASTTFNSIDTVRIEQVLLNLLRNSLYAAKREVVVTCHIDTDRVSYCFEDDGEGIPDDIRAHLFEPFFTTKPAGAGTGLGLSVAHAAAHDHGGSIEVSDSATGGAKFCLVLPRAETP